MLMTHRGVCAGFAAAISTLAASTANAQLHAGDVILFRDSPAGNAVRTGGATGLTPFPARVFTARFGDSGFANRTTNPGLNAVPDQYFTSAITGLTITRAVRKWANGNLCTIPPERITLTKLGVNAVSPAMDVLMGAGPSVTMGISDPFDGAFHEHGAFALGEPFEAGIYVLEMMVWVGSPTSTDPMPSEPFWVVFNQNSTPQEQADCVDYLLAHGAGSTGGIVSLCPCVADVDGSGTVTVQDLFAYLNAWFAGDPQADLNDNGVDVQDIFDFLNAWFAGCP